MTFEPLNWIKYAIYVVLLQICKFKNIARLQRKLCIRNSYICETNKGEWLFQCLLYGIGSTRLVHLVQKSE